MAREMLSMRKLSEVLRLRLGQKVSVRKIAGSCCLARSTVSDYLVRAKAAGLGWPLPEGMNEEQLEQLLFPVGEAPASARTPLDMAYIRNEMRKKGVTQTIQLADFLGHNANAVRWQIWTGLLTHLLVRFLAFRHSWQHSFTRLFTVVRAVLWRRWHLGELLDRSGTAS